MSLSIAKLEFSRELYLEHCDEISFLYETRGDDLISDKLQWPELQDDEGRIDAHLDALLIGGQAALDNILDLCNEGDASAYYITTCLYCRNANIRGLFQFFAKLESDTLLVTPDTLNAVKDALLQEWPESWFAALANYPFQQFPKLVSVFVPLYGNRRQPLAEKLFSLAIKEGLLPGSYHLKAARQLNNCQALNKDYWKLTKKEQSHSIQEKVLCLLQLTQTERTSYIKKLLDFFQKQFPEHKIPYTVFSIAADKPLARQICSLDEELTLARVLAIGMTGLPEDIPLLLSYLNNEAVAPTAALALQIITGADMMTEQFRPETWGEAELFDDELADFKQGKAPQHPEGRPYGQREIALSSNPNDWQAWVQHYGDNFQPGLRYRFGYPMSPRTLVYTLSHPAASRLIRYLSHEELLRRYDSDSSCANIPFNTDDWVHKQYSAIYQLSQWADNVEQHFEPGGWYLNGHPISPDLASDPPPSVK